MQEPWVAARFRALQRPSNRTLHAVLYPHPCMSRLPPIWMGTCHRIIQAGASSSCWRFILMLAPTGERCQLALNGLRLTLVRQAMRAVRNLLLSNLSCSPLCSWLCAEPGWDARLSERRYKTGGGQPRLRPTNPAGIQTQMQP